MPVIAQEQDFSGWFGTGDRDHLTTQGHKSKKTHSKEIFALLPPVGKIEGFDCAELDQRVRDMKQQTRLVDLLPDTVRTRR